MWLQFQCQPFYVCFYICQFNWTIAAILYILLTIMYLWKRKHETAKKKKNWTTNWDTWQYVVFSSLNGRFSFKVDFKKINIKKMLYYVWPYTFSIYDSIFCCCNSAIVWELRIWNCSLEKSFTIQIHFWLYLMGLFLASIGGLR